RAEAVALADSWSVSAGKLGGRAGAERLLAAGMLREQLFRLEHRDADALEAIELYEQAAKLHVDAACRGLSSAALLQGELRADPPQAARELVEAARAPADARCRERVQAALAALAPYAAGAKASEPATAAPSASSAEAASTSDGVVQP